MRSVLCTILAWSAWFATLAVAADPPGKGGKATVQKMTFGKTADGTAVDLYVLTNASGVKAKVITYGALLTEMHVPDRDGKRADVVLGFDNLDDYLKGHPMFGATVGRVANRIAGAKFTLEGKEYKLAANNGPNSIHGGNKGFDKAVWKAEAKEVPEGVSVRFTHRSPDGDEGYPGNLDVAVTYTLTEKNELTIDYTATTDKATPVNLTNHSYFNLSGGQSANVLKHEVMLTADKYTPADDKLIPTGKIEPVKGTPLDFTMPTAIGARFDQLKGKPVGYDHNYVLNSEGKSLALAARVVEPKSGRVLEMITTEPGVQLYTGNFLDGKLKGKGGVVYGQHAGFCLEAQHFPDAVHHPEFPSIILQPGKTYTQTTIYKFSTK
jgi:aldose 1-epimerase